MFFLSVTTDINDSSFPSLSVKRLRSGRLVITLATDTLPILSEADERGLANDGLLRDTQDSLEVASDEIVVKGKESGLELSTPLISGGPLYYHINSNGEFYCSSHIGLLRRAGISIREDAHSLPEFFVYRYVMAPRTMYEDIRQLPAGSTLSVQTRGNRCEVNIEPAAWPEPAEKSDLVEKVSMRTLDILAESMHGLYPYRNSLTVLLSGGLDSSILYQLCRRLYGTDETYSAGFPFEDPKRNAERDYALSAAESLKARHRYCDFSTAEFLVGLIRGIDAAEGPMHHLQSVLLYLLFDKIPREKKAIISGLGADDIFGPRLDWYIYRLNMPLMQLLLRPFRSWPLALAGSKKIGRLLQTEAALKRPFEDPDNIIWSLGAYGSRVWVCDYFGVKTSDVIAGRCLTIRTIEHRSIYDIVSLYTFLGSASATKAIWHRLGEERGKSVYYPYCDESLLRYIYGVPWAVKLAQSKSVLRKAAEHLGVPDFIIRRPKQGFGVATDRWGEKGGVFEPLVPLCGKAFNMSEMRDMQSADPEKAMTFWNMLNYGLWKRLCIDNESADTLVEELQASLSCSKISPAPVSVSLGVGT